MSGTVAAVSSPDAVTGGNAAWDYAVPLGQEVGLGTNGCACRS